MIVGPDLSSHYGDSGAAQNPQTLHYLSIFAALYCSARSAAISVMSFFKLNAVQHHCHSAWTPSRPRSRKRRMSKQTFSPKTASHRSAAVVCSGRSIPASSCDRGGACEPLRVRRESPCDRSSRPELCDTERPVRSHRIRPRNRCMQHRATRCLTSLLA